MKVFDENLTFSLRMQGYSFSTSKDVLAVNIAREESVAVYGLMHRLCAVLLPHKWPRLCIQ